MVLTAMKEDLLERFPLMRLFLASNVMSDLSLFIFGTVHQLYLWHPSYDCWRCSIHRVFICWAPTAAPAVPFYSSVTFLWLKPFVVVWRFVQLREFDESDLAMNTTYQKFRRRILKSSFMRPVVSINLQTFLRTVWTKEIISKFLHD